MKRFLCLCQAFCIVALCLLTGCQSNDTKLYEQLTNQAVSEQTPEQTSRQDAGSFSTGQASERNAAGQHLLR